MRTATPASGEPARPRQRGGFVLWMVLAVCLFAGFVLLGNWQIRRLHWKLGLIHDVATRVHAPPVPAPGPSSWKRIEAGHLQYLHVLLTGRFLAGKQTLVHGTSVKGYGYWMMVPFQTDRGFLVLVNRGYVPPDLVGTQAYAGTRAPEGTVTLTGLLRLTEPHGGFLRPNHPDTHQWYSRDVAAIAQADDLSAAQVAPYFVDADAGTGSQEWPAGGLTKIHFDNPHLGYAITWYLMALSTALGVGVMIFYRARHTKYPSH